MMPIAPLKAQQSDQQTPRLLVIACGALARELLVITRLHGFAEVTLECLPAGLHNHPTEIPGAVDERLTAAQGNFDHVLVGYADCGTGGLLDDVCRRHGATRLPGAHCYEFFTGHDAFTELHDADPTTFYLTDYLAKHFDRIILDGLGITAHPELLGMYFANYRNLIHLSQTDDPKIEELAAAAAERLGLNFEIRRTGYGELQTSVVEFVSLSRRRIDPRSVAEPTTIEQIRETTS
jgi:hypothetical protein